MTTPDDLTARPTLTVERLAALLREGDRYCAELDIGAYTELPEWAHHLAAWLLPRLGAVAESRAPTEPSAAAIEAADKAHDVVVARFLDEGGDETGPDAIRAALRAAYAIDDVRTDARVREAARELSAAEERLREHNLREGYDEDAPPK